MSFTFCAGFWQSVWVYILLAITVSIVCAYFIGGELGTQIGGGIITLAFLYLAINYIITKVKYESKEDCLKQKQKKSA